VNVRAAVLHEIGRPLAVERVTLSHLGLHDVLVRLRASGSCHTDLEVIEGALAYPLPIILGHEGAGVVEAVGVARPRQDIPWLAREYLEGRLKLDELIIQRLPLEQINDGFAGMAKDAVVRAVLTLN
jgi:Zn-dependent alcohol dehydrogenase